MLAKNLDFHQLWGIFFIIDVYFGEWPTLNESFKTSSEELYQVTKDISVINFEQHPPKKS